MNTVLGCDDSNEITGTRHALHNEEIPRHRSATSTVRSRSEATSEPAGGLNIPGCRRPDRIVKSARYRIPRHILCLVSVWSAITEVQDTTATSPRDPTKHRSPRQSTAMAEVATDQRPLQLWRLAHSASGHGTDGSKSERNKSRRLPSRATEDQPSRECNEKPHRQRCFKAVA